MIDLDDSVVPEGKYRTVDAPNAFYSPSNRLKYITVCYLGKYAMFRKLIGGTWQEFELTKGFRLWRKMERTLPMAVTTEVWS